jgi:hypothetical protein
MTITTIHTTIRTRRFGRASLAAGAVSLLVLASACGTETATGEAPSNTGATAAASPRAGSPADSSEKLLDQRKTRQPDTTEPQYLAPTGRPVPLPGQSD